MAIHDKAVKESHPLPFLGTVVKPPVHKTHQISALKGSAAGKQGLGMGKLCLRQGPMYIRLARFTKELKKTLNLPFLASSSHMLRLYYGTERGTHGFANTKQTLCH